MFVYLYKAVLLNDLVALWICAGTFYIFKFLKILFKSQDTLFHSNSESVFTMQAINFFNTKGIKALYFTDGKKGANFLDGGGARKGYFVNQMTGTVNHLAEIV